MSKSAKHLLDVIFLEKGHLLGLFLALLGSGLLQYYLLNVDLLSIWLLVSSAIIAAVGVLLSFRSIEVAKGNKNYAILTICITYFSLVIIPFVRFNSLSGNDMLFEFMAAQNTLAHGWNTLSSLQSWYVGASHLGYMSGLSITVLPVMITKITGLNMVFVFKFVLSGIIATTPLLIYLTVKETFRNSKLAVLSSIIFSEFYYSFQSISVQGARQSIAILFVLFSLFVIAKLLNKNRCRSYFLLLPLFLFGIVFSHYTITYLSIVLFLSFTIISTLLSKNKLIRNVFKVNFHEIPFTLHLLQFVSAIFIVLSLIWFLAVPSSRLQIDLHNIMSLSQGRSLPAFDTVSTQYISGSPLGPWIDYWLYFGVILIIVGYLFLLFSKKDARISLFLISGGMFFALILASFVIPNFWAIYGGFLRSYITGYFVLCTFAAVALLAFDKKLRGLLLPAFLILSLPMGLLLPANERYVLYHPEETVSPTVAIAQNYVTDSEFAASVWVKNYVPVGEQISTDYRGAVNMYYANHPMLTVNPPTFPDYYYSSSYLYLTHFAVSYGLWLTPLTEQVDNIDVNSIIACNNIIYDDGNMVLSNR